MKISTTAANKMAVIPPTAAIQLVHRIDFQRNLPHDLDSRARGNDGNLGRQHIFTTSQWVMLQPFIMAVSLCAASPRIVERDHQLPTENSHGQQPWMTLHPGHYYC